ncbi:MAG: dimethyl sulfoxide reductase anchor subunit [Bacteroidales bacterium]|nr:dimethyl sulfoxide reductase anchor subunit [Bacteroidales bacterium]
MNRGFVFDREACVGCEACVIACSIANEGESFVPWRQVYTFNPFRLPGLPVFFYSLACNHCQEAPCIPACPARAYSRDPVTGAVILNRDACIGCRYCTWACPYDAPQFNETAGTMEKCTFCTERLQRGEEPACVAGCPVDALSFIAFEPETAVQAAGFPEKNTVPLLQMKTAPVPPVPDISYRYSPDDEEKQVLTRDRAEKISLKREWSLLSFTLLVPLMTGILARNLIHPHTVFFLIFAGIGLLATGLSLLHLGKPARALKAMRNVRHSWLSREIIGFSLFFASSLLFFLWPGKPFLGLVALVTGVLTLWVMDQVYRFAENRWLFLVHSSSTMLTGLLWISIAWMQAYAILFILFLKIGLYLIRKMSLYRYGKIRYLTFLVIRLTALASSAFYLITGPAFLPLLFTILLAGEIVDRIEFYLEQEIPGMFVSFGKYYEKSENKAG